MQALDSKCYWEIMSIRLLLLMQMWNTRNVKKSLVLGDNENVKIMKATLNLKAIKYEFLGWY